jgi:hypothetical protein
MSRKHGLATKAVLAATAVCLCAAGLASARYSGGDGSPENPYRIATPNDLNDIGNHVEDFNKCFIMVNDINMPDFIYRTALIAPDIDNSSDYSQGTPFSGTFDGNDCIISNLTIDTAGADNDYLGLFGMVEETGEVKNLGIENLNITGGSSSYCVGGLVAHNWGSVSRCHAGVSLSGGSKVGGLVGRNACRGRLGSISNCYTTGYVTGSDAIGGLVGSNGCGSISTSYAAAVTTGTSDRVGGLAGWHDLFSYAGCFWDVTVNPDVNGIGNGSDPNVIGKTTVEMQMRSTFTDAGWDFVEVWDIGENQTYPYLRVHSPGDLNHDGVVDWRDFAIFANDWLEETE